MVTGDEVEYGAEKGDECLCWSETQCHEHSTCLPDALKGIMALGLLSFVMQQSTHQHAANECGYKPLPPAS